jgi:NAD(P)-dependent dehydrogenase (short-subunit alcohol dehydrogenase family)
LAERAVSRGSLHGRVALVAGATRGAGRGTAVALGEDGATVYRTGRTTRERRSEYDLPVNAIWGGERLFEWNAPVWEHDLPRARRAPTSPAACVILCAMSIL